MVTNAVPRPLFLISENLSWFSITSLSFLWVGFYLDSASESSSVSLLSGRLINRPAPLTACSLYQSGINLLSFILLWNTNLHCIYLHTHTHTHVTVLFNWQWVSPSLYYLSKVVKSDSTVKIRSEFTYFYFINSFTFDKLGTCVM